MKNTLYDISEEIISILGQEEWTDETEKQLEKLNLSLEAKAQGIVDFCANLDSFIEAAKKEEQRIASRRKAAENRKESLKEYMKNCLLSIERDCLEFGIRKLRIQDNPPKVVIDNESDIPAKYYVVIPQTTQVDKKMLADDLKKGKVEGAHLERGKSLRIY